MSEELAACQIDLSNEIKGHSYTRRKVIKRLNTAIVANSRGNKQHVVDYLLKELVEELEKAERE